MPSLRERILDLLTSEPGLMDRELADRLCRCTPALR
jgi:hypothetical protein